MTEDAKSEELTALYRFFDSAGSLLYVGISTGPWRRWMMHSTDKPWWFDIASITLEAHQSRGQALAAEAVAIQFESPLHNRVIPRLPGKKHSNATSERPIPRARRTALSTPRVQIPNAQGENELSATQVAAALGISPRMLTRHAATGQILGRQLGWSRNSPWVFTREEVERFKRERRPAHRPRIKP